MNGNSYFDNHINEYKNGSDYFKFKITKTCGYSFLILIHKNKTLIDLYEEIDLRMFSDDNNSILFLYHTTISDENKLELETIKINDYISNLELTGRITPRYSYPSPVIYELYLDIVET